VSALDAELGRLCAQHFFQTERRGTTGKLTGATPECVCRHLKAALFDEAQTGMQLLGVPLFLWL